MKKYLPLKTALALGAFILCSPLTSNAGMSSAQQATCRQCADLKACTKCQTTYFDNGYIPCLASCHTRHPSDKTNAACRNSCNAKNTTLFNKCVSGNVSASGRSGCSFATGDSD